MDRSTFIPSPFCHPRKSYPLDMIVLHHIGSKGEKLYSVGGAITWFTNVDVHRNPKTGKIENKVSAHYIIPRSPYKDHDVIQLVKAQDIAYHAGRSQWVVDGKTRKHINNYSIGIELEGDGNLVEYTDYQYEFLTELVKELLALHSIPEENIVGHEDVAPDRKVDPGKLFDWKRLRKAVSPPLIIMPEVSVRASEEHAEERDQATVEPGHVEDREFRMEDGTDKPTGFPGFLSSIISIIRKIFST